MCCTSGQLEVGVGGQTGIPDPSPLLPTGGVPGQVSLTLSDPQTCLDTGQASGPVVLWYFLLLFSPFLILAPDFSPLPCSPWRPS